MKNGFIVPLIAAILVILLGSLIWWAPLWPFTWIVCAAAAVGGFFSIPYHRRLAVGLISTATTLATLPGVLALLNVNLQTPQTKFELAAKAVVDDSQPAAIAFLIGGLLVFLVYEQKPSSKPFTWDFNEDSWDKTSASSAKLTITERDHGKGLNPMVSVRENGQEVGVATTICQTTGDVTIETSGITFTGRCVIS